MRGVPIQEAYRELPVAEREDGVVGKQISEQQKKQILIYKSVNSAGYSRYRIGVVILGKPFCGDTEGKQGGTAESYFTPLQIRKSAGRFLLYGKILFLHDKKHSARMCTAGYKERKR